MTDFQRHERQGKQPSPEPVRVLMVCLGNICRSPTAQGVISALLEKKGLSSAFFVDSAGTANYHIGKSPDARAINAAAKRGYDISHLVARQVVPEDFDRFDYIFAMDEDNLEFLESLQKQSKHQRTKYLGLLLNLSDEGMSNVPDPYYTGSDGFELVLDLIETASERLLNEIASDLDNVSTEVQG